MMFPLLLPIPFRFDDVLDSLPGLVVDERLVRVRARLAAQSTRLLSLSGSCDTNPEAVVGLETHHIEVVIRVRREGYSGSGRASARSPEDVIYRYSTVSCASLAADVAREWVPVRRRIGLHRDLIIPPSELCRA